ncbi:MAG: proline--tRNA ligase, partial [Pyrinomonadaceae bacterium MAG19_C2-C3]|nr:proline--tRNA ligase [Pyrinomonadaceae bacterium MAG19_C2-C3]
MVKIDFNDTLYQLNFSPIKKLMRWSQLFTPTLRDNPADAEVTSHRLLLRAGFVRQLAAGIYSYLPLAQRSILKITDIVRQEMNAIGGQEFFLPALNPREIWEESGRWSVMGDNMFRLRDRKGADLCLAMTHEEVFTSIARGEIRSYKQLPQTWYQIQTKFRDEPRPKSGLLRVRQFTMKDAYSFDVDAEGLDKSFNDEREAYKKIFDRCGLRYAIVEASSGAMGGSESNEFMVRTDAGEDEIAQCTGCDYAANVEKATSQIPPVTDEESDTNEPQEFPTPGVRTIEDLTNFDGGAQAENQIKTLVYIASFGSGDSLPVLALLRGDHQLHETKLADALTATEVRPAQAEEINELLGAHAGSLGAVGTHRQAEAAGKTLHVIADNALKCRRNMTTGANRDGFHIRGVDIARDITLGGFVEAPDYADLRTVKSGEECPTCNQPLEVFKALEIGHIFKLGTKYSEAMNATVLNQDGKPTPIVMGSYGIGIERILAAAIELHHDENGIIFPVSIAPFACVVTITNIKDEALKIAGENLYRELTDAGIDTLLDDRDERAGVKFKDAELIGIPYRITIGKKLSEGKVEFFTRQTKQSGDVELNDAVKTLEGVWKLSLAWSESFKHE